MSPVSWSFFKQFILDTKLPWIYVEEPNNNYSTYVTKDNVTLTCYLTSGSSDYTDFNDNHKSLGNQPMVDNDPDGRQIQRSAATYKGWRYLAHPIEFSTSKLNSVVEKDWTGANRSNCTIQYYDNTDTEITSGLQTDLDANCVKTIITFAPSHDLDIIGGNVHQHTTPTSDLRLWVIAGATDIKASPGAVREFVGGLNFRYILPGDKIETDGRASARLNLSTEGIPVPTNKMQYILEHPAGHQHELMIVVEYFRA